MAYDRKAAKTPTRHLRDRFLYLPEVSFRRFIFVQLREPAVEILVKALRQSDVDLGVLVDAPDRVAILATHDPALQIDCVEQ